MKLLCFSLLPSRSKLPTSDDVGGGSHVHLPHDPTQGVAIVMGEGGVNPDGIIQCHLWIHTQLTLHGTNKGEGSLSMLHPLHTHPFNCMWTPNPPICHTHLATPTRMWHWTITLSQLHPSPATPTHLHELHEDVGVDHALREPVGDDVEV